MKVLKSLFLCVGTVLLALNFTACTDWGDADPEAGNQTYPDRSVVNTYTFDYGADDVYLGDITDKADVCEAVEDADLGSNVLHLDANGYAVMANPFNGVKLQNGAAITFWLKTAAFLKKSRKVKSLPWRMTSRALFLPLAVARRALSASILLPMAS